MSQIYEGQLRVVTSGEFRGQELKVGRVYPTLVELRSWDEAQERWVSFCSVTPAECEQMTKDTAEDYTPQP